MRAKIHKTRFSHPCAKNLGASHNTAYRLQFIPDATSREDLPMEIRHEAHTIMSMLPDGKHAFITGSTERVAELVQALSNADIEVWHPYPINALATGLTTASNSEDVLPAQISESFLNYLSDTPPGPLSQGWRQPILEAVHGAGEHYFNAADRNFQLGDMRSAAHDLCSAVNCAVIGQAAIHGWPHADAGNDINTVLGLDTGTLPTDLTQFTALIDSTADENLDLNSAYGAATGILQAVDHGYFHAFGYTPETATQLARHAFGLIARTGEPTP